MKKMFFSVMLSSILISSGSAFAANDPDYILELSFGNSLLFLDQGYTDSSGTVKKRTLPVSSYLFLSEIRVSRLFTIAAAWNLPYTTVKRVEGNAVTEKYVAPAYGAGFTCIFASVPLWGNTRIEPEIALLVFRTYNSTSSKGNIFYPVSVAKLNITRDSGMNIYFGVSQAPAKNTTAFVYGIGQRF